MPALPWIKFSFEDFFEDPAVMQMSNEEIGAYLRLLQVAWHRGGILPDDDSYLASVSRIGPQWGAHREAISRAWGVHDGIWEQKRIVRECEEVEALQRSAVENGRIGAQKRWGAYRGHDSPNSLEEKKEKKEREERLDSKSAFRNWSLSDSKPSIEAPDIESENRALEKTLRSMRTP